MSLRTIFETCRPRADVEAGTTKDEQFAADLAQVVNKTAPKEYADPAVFFPHSYPTRGMTGVSGIEEFVDPALLPKGPVRVAALDGENSDPANGLTLEPGLRAK